MDSSLPEIISIGIYNSSLAARGKAVTPNRKTSMFEIEIPIEKGGTSYIDNEEMPIEPDMIICAKPGQTRHTRVPFRCYYIHMILKEGTLFSALLDMPSFIKTDKKEFYLKIFKKLCKYYDTALENDEIILHSLILELIYNLISDSKKQQFNAAGGGSRRVIEAVIKYIKDNLTADLSLEAVSAYAGFSPIHFHNCFKAATGMTLRSYVENQRIKKAANMLVTTNSTLAVIAYECGFSSQSYFSFAFKRKMGLSPREYAKTVFNRYNRRNPPQPSP